MKEVIIQNHIKTKLDYDILELYFTKISISIKDAFEFKLPATLNKNKGLLLFGRGPIWLYLILYKKIKDAKAAAWIAQYDATTSTAVKFENGNAENAKINLKKFVRYLPAPENPMTIALIGPPNSGKTVFMYALFNKLLTLNPVFVHRNYYIIKGNPDGGGLWSANMPDNLLQFIRNKYDYIPAFVADVIEQIKKTSRIKKIIFVDCGGKISDENKQILSKCTHAILVSNNKKESEEWRKAYHGLKYMAIIDSYKNVRGKQSSIKNIDKKGTYYMDMTDLRRGNKKIQIPERFLDFFLK